jgi:ParB-like chromosome segregation protein Spo0J
MEKITWQTEKRLVRELTPCTINPRSISKIQFDQLKESLRKFDYAEIIAIQPDGMIIAGHMRVKAMLALKWHNKQIEVRVPNRPLTCDEAKEYLIRSNRNTGEWDFDALSSEFELSDLCEWGFHPEEFGIYLDQCQSEEETEPLKCPTCGKKNKPKKEKK